MATMKTLNGYGFDSAKLGGKAPEYYTWTNNLLKNSNFASKYLINLNGKTEYTDIGDVFSGWIKESTSVLTLNDDYITIDNSANNNTEQIIYTDRKEEAEKLIGKTVTLAVCTSEGDIHCASGIVSTDTACAVVYTEKFDCALQFFSNTGSYQLTRLIIKAGKTISIKWIVLYEGAYTAETLSQPQWLHPRLEMIRMGLPTQPRNLLDNSDFTNPVNQRGIYSAINGSYIIDRWNFYNSNFTGNVTITQSANGITVTNDADADRVAIVQKIIDKNYYDGKYTAVAKTTDGLAFGYTEVMDAENGIYQVSIWIPTGVTVVWAALYEGSYTAETLPPYVPKGYAAEFAECRRYYKRFTAPYAGIAGTGYITGSTKYIYINPPDNYPMRIDKPSFAFKGVINVRGINGYIVEDYGDAVIRVYENATGCIPSLEITRGDSAAWNATNNTPIAVQFRAKSVLELIADL